MTTLRDVSDLLDRALALKYNCSAFDVFARQEIELKLRHFILLCSTYHLLQGAIIHNVTIMLTVH